MLLLPIVLYALLILFFAYHWQKAPFFKAQDTPLSTKVSVIIPFKNEGDKLSALVDCLLQQTYPSSCCEFIFVDDHSDDNAKNLVSSGKNIIVLQSEGRGKKAALLHGIKHSSGELIVLLDADCLIGVDFLKTIVSFYSSSSSDLIIGPVRLQSAASVWSQIQAVEFQSLVASTAGAALSHHPIMCNGANLAFKRSLFDFSADLFKSQYVSGDDMFLLEYAKKKLCKIGYLKSKAAMVSTYHVSWTAFWAQRFRWTSKASAYRDLGVVFVAILVLFANLSLLLLPFLSLSLYIRAFVIKAFVDSVLLFLTSGFFNTPKSVLIGLFISPFYPLYVAVSAFGVVFSKYRISFKGSK